MDMEPVNYFNAIGVLPDPIGAMNKELAFKSGLDAQNAENQQRLAIADKERRAEERQAALEHALSGSDGSAASVSRIMMQFPEAADEIKKGWDVKDSAARQTDLTQLGEIYSAANSGNYELAAKAARARLDADKAAGQADASDEAIVSALESGDPAKQKAALTMIGTHLAAATGAEHFGTVYGALKGGVHVVPMGGILANDTGETIAHSPLIEDAQGNIRAWGEGAATGPASSDITKNINPKMQAVASTLGTALPAPVVAGFMGNFHIEGGWDGAQGDGGSASGIGQWRNERAANFERVIGKPVTEATPEDQAKFVLHEMQHPEEAGMTPAQRDQIMAAKTPGQAAALIDKFYERSDGKARGGRMAAAKAFAGVQGSTAQAGGDQFPVLIAGKNAPAPEGFRWTDESHSALEAIPGGPKDPKANGSGPAPQELEDAATQYLLTGQMPALGNGSAGLKQQILAKRSDIMKRVGITAEQLPAFQAQYKADQTALSENGKLLSNLQSSENALKANGQQVWNTHRQLVQDGIIADNPWVTRKRLDYYTQFGSPDQRAHVKTYLDAVNAYSAEYSKFMTAANGMGGSAAPSDSARQQAGELNDPGLAATPLLSHLRQGLTEAINKRNGVAAQNQSLQQKLSSYLHPHDQHTEPKESGWITLPSGLKVRKVH